MTAAVAAAELAARPTAVRAGRYIRDHVIYVYTAFAILYLMLPVAVMALFSFNDPPGKSNVAWHGFSARCLAQPVRRAGPVRRRPDERRSSRSCRRSSRRSSGR